MKPQRQNAGEKSTQKHDLYDLLDYMDHFMAQIARKLPEKSVESLISEFTKVRETTLDLFKPLQVEDAVVQSDSFGSPPNWHIAHVTWFFHKLLDKHGAKNLGSKDFGIKLEYLNSYYQKFGNILPKAERGKFPRPTVSETLQYRSLIDLEIPKFLRQAELDSSRSISKDLYYDIMLGNQHEMQHQELMVYDFQHYFQRFPDPEDNYKPSTVIPHTSSIAARPTGMASITGGLFELGYSGEGFSYDNELPQHKVYLQPFKIDIAPVTNGEYAKFVEAGGYQDFKYWLADGWELVQEQGWTAPLYWKKNNDGGGWIKKSFGGIRALDSDKPVVNVSFYEADAYARWAGKRLPTEAEWEKAASWNEDQEVKTLYPWGNNAPTPDHANLLESYHWEPAKVGSYPKGTSHYGCHQMIGDVWEWTASEYVLYPGFKSLFPEYTDKWAVNQKVLRGGCFATPTLQIRNSYRNYFKPHERILFAGFRCALDT